MSFPAIGISPYFQATKDGFPIYSFLFDGSGENFNGGDVFDDVWAGTSKEFTYCCWLRRQQLGRETIFSKWGGATNQRSILFEFNASNQLKVFISATGTSTIASYTGAATYTDLTNFIFILLSYKQNNSVATKFSLRVNDVDDALTQAGNSGQIFNGTEDFIIGSLPGGVNPLDAYKLQPCLFNIQLSGAEKTEAWAEGKVLDMNTHSREANIAEYWSDNSNFNQDVPNEFRWKGEKGNADLDSLNMEEEDRTTIVPAA